jgi:hypothetical protein
MSKSLVLLFIAAAVCSMVRGWSEAVRLARYLRAKKQGFLRPKPKDTRFVAVDGRLAPAVRVMVKSLTIHAQHDAQSGSTHHHARQATLQVRNDISEEEFKASMSWHAQTGKAKHNIPNTLAARGVLLHTLSWADASMSSSSSCAAVGGDDCVLADNTLNQDAVFLNDPWAAAAEKLRVPPQTSIVDAAFCSDLGEQSPQVLVGDEQTIHQVCGVFERQSST